MRGELVGIVGAAGIAFTLIKPNLMDFASYNCLPFSMDGPLWLGIALRIGG